MNANVLTASTPTSAKYWAELKDLSDNTKLELITLLSISMVRNESKEKSDHWADRFCGVWQDNRSTEEIIDDIRGMRTTNHFDVEL